MLSQGRPAEPVTPLERRECPWCGRFAGWREPAGSEATALLWRIAWQSTVFAVVDLARNPFAQVPAWVGAKGREQACQACGRLVRVCPSCDRPHRWLDARLLTCGCGRAFL